MRLAMKLRPHLLLAASACLGATACAPAPKPVVAPTAPAAPPPVADVDRGRIPEGGPPPALNLPSPARFKLPSGAQVLVVERHTLPMVAVSVVWAAGAASETAEQAGIAGLTAALLDEGTTRRTSIELAEAFESLGAGFEVGSGWDSTGATLTTLTRELDPALDLLAEVLATPAFAEKELERLRTERITALLQQRDSASQLASNRFASAVYGEERRYGDSCET